MGTRQTILEYIRKNQSATGVEIARHLNISKQDVNKHIKALILSQQIQKVGTTRGAFYILYSPKSQSGNVLSLKKVYILAGLEEDIVFSEIERSLNLKNIVTQHVHSIIRYMFTEILNNAIDHSNSESCSINVMIDQYQTRIIIRDYGIGIFYSIYTKYGLRDENEAVGELLKGKTTTMGERHSGEGVFFTSKIARHASFRSHKINLIFENDKNDIFVKQQRSFKGTEVTLQISNKARKRLDSVFNQFAPEEYDYQFEKTRVNVKLFHQHYISRSEARRMLSGLDKFKEIILDFKNVKTMGQAFTDEIFRVFQKRYPDIKIQLVNLSPQLVPMIRHVVDNKI